jgi:hypothetical protein
LVDFFQGTDLVTLQIITRDPVTNEEGPTDVHVIAKHHAALPAISANLSNETVTIPFTRVEGQLVGDFSEASTRLQVYKGS